MRDEGTNLLEGEPRNRGGEQDAGKRLCHSRAEAPSQAFPAAHPPGQVPREPARVPTLLFLKLTRNGLVRLSAVSSRPRGLLRLAPTSCCPWRISCWAGARPGPARPAVTQGFLSASGVAGGRGPPQPPVLAQW